MLCERCKQKTANVQLTEIINNKKKTIRLCEDCAKEMQVDNWGWSPQFSLQNFLVGLLGHDFGAGSLNHSPKESNNCKKCGLIEEQFAKKGLLGCGECYEEFSHRLEPLIRRIQGNTRHTGKVPARTGGNVRLAKEIETLKNKLQEAIKKEEFEQAAVLRDKIRELEKMINQEG